MKVKIRKYKRNKLDEDYQMGGASPVGIYTGGYNPNGNTVFNNPPPFTYEITSLNSNLSQKGNSTPNEMIVHKGTRIKGKNSQNGKTYKGRVDTIIRDEEGYIKYVIILNEKDRKFVKVDDDIFILM